MSIVKQVLAGASGSQGGEFTIDNSLRFRQSASAYLSRTFSTPTDNKKWTWSGWVKRGKLSISAYSIFGQYTNSTNRSDLYFDANDKLNFYNYVSGSVSPSPQLITSQAFRDPSAWYHIVLVWDSNNATAADRQIIYVNGTRITSYQSSATVALGQSSQINSATGHTIGEFENNNVNFDGYLTEINFIDGQALDPTDFGESNEDTGVWQPKRYTGSYGTNGFRLDGSGVTDSSGNGNNWTNNNLNLTTSSATTYDLMTDSPTLTDENTANYATLNPLMLRGVGLDVAQGNLYANRNSAGWGNIAATIGVSSGKFYWEFLNDSTAATMVGVDSELEPTDYVGHTSTGYGYYALTGNKYNNRSSSSYGDTYTTGDIVGFALDMDNGKIWFAKNGVWQASGDPEAGTNEAFSGLTGTYFPQFSFNNSGGDGYINFGQRPFTYTPPTGFLPLNTYNLPDSTIVDGSEHFNIVLYTGNGSTQSITGVGFQPDFLWLKRRDSAENHGLHDVIRGSTNFHVSNQNANQYTAANSVTSFDSDGFSLGNYSNTNTSGSSMVAWNWKANGSGVSNTVGSINSTVSANTTAGFSIVQYTGNGLTSSGQTVGHGLGLTPEMIITKLQSGTQYNWSTWHKDLPAAAGIWLNLTSARNTAMWNGYVNMSSTVFSPADLLYNNVSGATYINYVFAGVEGFSKFGSYTGNGSTDGVFIYTGFRPAFVIYKSTTFAGTSWIMYDSSRNLYNSTDASLYAESSSAETTSYDLDFLSNGIKIRATTTNLNGSGQSYIYAAFAENPFKNALAR